MKIGRVFKTKPPVIYRWLRGRRYFSYAVVLCCVFLALPVGVVVGARLSGVLADGRAAAATRAAAPDASVPGQRNLRRAAALSRRVISDPAALSTLSEPDFLAMLHAPDLQRQDGVTRMWQYQSDSCVLDVYLEESGSVIYHEIRPRKTASLDGKNGEDKPGRVGESKCLKILYRQRNKL